MNRATLNSVFRWANPATIGKELGARLGRFLSFGNSSLYFSNLEPTGPELLPEENILLLPIGSYGHSFALLRLEQINPVEAAPLLPCLDSIAELCVENVIVNLALLHDLETGLHTEAGLVETLASRLEGQHQEEPASRKALPNTCTGFIVLNWPEAREARDGADQAEFEKFVALLANTFRASLPTGSIAARIGAMEGRCEFAAAFPAPGRGVCNRLARKMIAALERPTFYNRLLQSRSSARFCAGHALYPQDLKGHEFASPPREQVLLLRDRARLAADVAWQTWQLRAPCLAFGWIPVIGGKIHEILPHSMVRITLGRNANIQPGQRFHVIDRNSSWNAAGSKAQIVIQSVGETEARASILHIRHPGASPCPGDGLLLIRNRKAAGAEDVPGLLTHADFVRKFEVARRKTPAFTLAITKFWNSEERQESAVNAETARREFRERLTALGKFLLTGCELPVLAGWYGSDGMIFFQPGDTNLPAFINNLHKAASGFSLETATGLFSYPCLNLTRADSELHALKALEYASLLPPPHIGHLDAFALAISADKRFSQGDEFGALEEYRLALLLKPDDALILNSMGVCLAALHRQEDALGKFLEALERTRTPDIEAKICYNLGNLFQKQSDLAEARGYYRRCLKASPDHIYAWTRLGQIYDMAGRPGASRAFYRHASKLAHNDPDALSLIQRKLAQLEDAGNHTQKAREILHDSLLRNPEDKASLLLLARTYVDDDPAMAETLARKCLRMGANAWTVLIDALAALGRNEEAREAMLKRDLYEQRQPL